MADGLLVEGKGRFRILVIEDSPEYGKNALEGLAGHDVVIAATLDMARKALETGARFDFILSDVHFPARAGEEATAQVSGVLGICFENDIPACFVTKADHHGLLELGDEGYISLRALALGEIASTRLELSKGKGEVSEGELFRKLKAAAGGNIRAGSKTPEIWEKALQMAMNASAKIEPLAGAIRKVRGIGLDVVMDKGLPRVVPLKPKA